MGREDRLLTVGERAALKSLIDRDGDRAVTARIGLSSESIARAVAGFPVRTGTLTHLRMWIGEMVQVGEPPVVAS